MSENVEHPYVSVEKGKLFVHNESGLLLQEVAFYLSPEMAGGDPHQNLYWEGFGFSYPKLHHGKFMRQLSRSKTLHKWGKTESVTEPYELPIGSWWRVEILWATPDQRSHHHVQTLLIDD